MPHGEPSFNIECAPSNLEEEENGHLVFTSSFSLIKSKVVARIYIGPFGRTGAKSDKA